MSYSCWGLKAKNQEQKEAIKHLLNPNIDLVILNGVSGSGKTLLALAAGMELVLNKSMYTEIMFTRAPIGIGTDLGHIPGTVEEKMFPWCGALFDNLDMLIDTSKLSKTQQDGTKFIVQNKIKMMAMMHMRGRSLVNKWVIIDEVQNMFISEIKVLLTRAGDNCKIVCMGDTNQIDNKKLTEDNNALSYLIYKSQDEDFIKYINLPCCERSRLSAWAASTL